jgi:DNA-binding NarL/FixJ family response regulator
MKLRILLADDHETVREGLKAILNAQSDMEGRGRGARRAGGRRAGHRTLSRRGHYGCVDAARERPARDSGHSRNARRSGGHALPDMPTTATRQLLRWLERGLS